MAPVTKCPLCASATVGLYKAVNGCDISKCWDCKLLWVPETTEATLRGIFGNHYFKSQTGPGYQDYLADEDSARLDARDLLNQLPLKRGRLLDIGCAYGFLLCEARKQGFDACGIEPNRIAYNHAVKTLDLNVFNGSWSDCKFFSRQFNVVTIIGTLQHLRDPFAFIREAWRILNFDGYLVITTINSDSPFYRFLVPEHTHYFNKANISRLLESEGFKVVRCDGYKSRFRLGNLLSRLLNFALPMNQGADRWLNRAPVLRHNVRVNFNQMLILAKKV